MGIDNPAALKTARFASFSPSIDLSPSPDGHLEGRIRIGILALRKGHKTGSLVFRLPRNAEVTVPDPIVLGLGDPAPTPPFDCSELDRIFGIVEQLSDSLRFAWSIECKRDAVIVKFALPPQVKPQRPKRPGQYVELAEEGLGQAFFIVRRYSGLRRLNATRHQFAFVYDSSAIQGATPLKSRYSPASWGAGTRPTFRLTASNLNHRFDGLHPSTDLTLPAQYYGKGLSSLWAIPDYPYWTNTYAATLTDGEAEQHNEWLFAITGILAGYVLGLLAGYILTPRTPAQGDLKPRRGLKRLRRARFDANSSRRTPSTDQRLRRKPKRAGSRRRT